MRTKFKLLCVVGFFLLLLVNTAPSKDIIINPIVRFEGNWLIIKNNDDFSYDYVKIGLNDGKFNKELPFSIPSGEQVKYELSSFNKPDGERFDVFKYLLVDITISCEISKQIGKKWEILGRGFYSGKFK